MTIFSFRKIVHRCIVCVKHNPIEWNMWFSCFRVWPDSAEAQVIWGGVVKRRLIADFIGNISAKKYQNPFMCVKVIASQRWHVFLRHGVLSFSSCFSKWTWISRFPSSPPPPSVLKQNLPGQVVRVFMRRMSFLLLNHSVKALNGTQSTNRNRWPGLIFSSSTTGLLMVTTLLPLCWLSEEITAVIKLLLLLRCIAVLHT